MVSDRPAKNTPKRHSLRLIRDRERGRSPNVHALASDRDCDRQRKPSHPRRQLHTSGCLSDDGHLQSSPSPEDVVHGVKGASRYPHRCTAVHRMPPEILGIIFEHCLNEQASSVMLSESPLLLGRVCNYWRSISQSNHRLWTSLSLKFLETDIDRSRDDIKVATAIRTWLRRSYPAPLSLSFIDNRIFQKDTEDIVISLLSRICMHASRWKAIHLKFSSDYFTQLAVFSACPLTSLTSFSVHVDHMGWRRSLHSLHLDLTQASLLTSLAYTGPDHVIREDIFVNWARLTSIAFSYDLHESGGQTATLPRHFWTLAFCRNLTELSIGLSTTLTQHVNSLDAIAQGQTVELPRLHTLRVRRLSRSAYACALIDALRLPNLSTLDIDSAVLVGWDGFHTPLPHPDSPILPTQTHWWHAHHFSALLGRSACHLHTLRIRNVDMSPSELMRLLTSPSTSSTLTTFTFEPFPRTSSISDVLSHLTPVSETTCAQSPSINLSSSPGGSSNLSSGLSSSPSPSPNPTSVSGPVPPTFPCLTRLRLGCAHEGHLGPLASMIESRTGDRAVLTGLHRLAVFELVFYDFVYSHGRDGWRRGQQPWRKICFDAFKERVLRCAREGGVDVDIKVERPYEPVYLLTAPT